METAAPVLPIPVVAVPVSPVLPIPVAPKKTAKSAKPAEPASKPANPAKPAQPGQSATSASATGGKARQNKPSKPNKTSKTNKTHKTNKTKHVECHICQEDKKVSISCSCSAEICRECARQHLLAVDFTGCPQCRSKWSAEFVSQNCGSTWHSQVYRRHLRQVSVKHAQACRAQDSDSIRAYAEAVQQLDELSKNTRLAELTEQAARAQAALVNARMEMQHAVEAVKTRINDALDIKQQAKTKCEFVHCCAQPGCEGFLSTRGKCLVCSQWTCLACNTAKRPIDQTNQPTIQTGPTGPTGQTDQTDQPSGQPDWMGHVCRPEDLASVQLIRAKTTRCPACGVPCERSRGCDDMWCVMCHASFSYRTGQIRDRAVHNPEREKWLEGGQQAATRKRKADVLAKPGQTGSNSSNSSASSASQAGADCVVLVAKPQLTNRLRFLPPKSAAVISDVYNFAAHLRDNYLVEQQRQITTCCNPLALRVRFATKQIDVETLGTELERQQRRKDHLESCQSVFQVLFECLRDLINHAASLDWKASHATSCQLFDEFVKDVNRLLVFAQQRCVQIHRVSTLTLNLPGAMQGLIDRTASLLNCRPVINHPVVRYADHADEDLGEWLFDRRSSSASSASSASSSSSASSGSARSAGLDSLVRSVSLASQARMASAIP